MDDNNSLAHTTWNCKYYIVFDPKYSVFDENKYKKNISSESCMSNLI